jgi:co-chaperonin GroES (HSP10)
MKLNFRVQPNIILIEPIVEDETRESGLIVTATTSKRNAARITDIHPETAAAHGLAVGDTVLYNAFATCELYLSASEKRLAIVPGDILARIETEN